MPRVHETGRGWEIFPASTCIEPNLIQFAEQPVRLIDDGRVRRRSSLSQGSISHPDAARLSARPSTPISVLPYDWTSFSLCLPLELRIDNARIAQFTTSAA